MAKRLDFSLDFSLDFFNYSYFRNACQRKIFTITNICPLNETLLRLLSLDLLDKVAKRLVFFLDFCRVKDRVKNRVVWPGPKSAMVVHRGVDRGGQGAKLPCETRYQFCQKSLLCH